jgi:DNA-binding transcriptional MerR regulator
MNQHFLLSEVARAVGRKPYQIAYMLSNGEIEEPKLRIGNRRVFTHEEVATIKEIVQSKDRNKNLVSDTRRKGRR